MNNKEFRELKRELGNLNKSDLIKAILQEVMDTVKQGGINRISELQPAIQCIVEELFDGSRKPGLVSSVMSEIDRKLAVTVAVQ